MKPRRIPTDPEILAYARKMRHSDTRAERRAWVFLRERRMLGLKFHRQFPIANYIVDFYCEHLRLVLELDGGVHDDSCSIARCMSVLRSERGPSRT